jgi:hypothetical protein
MTTKTAPKIAPSSPAAQWRRDLVASIVLASGVLLSTCAFAGVWAATHPQAFNV